MKKFLLPLLLVLASCSSDDANIPVNETRKGLIGKWKLTGIVRDGEVFPLPNCFDQNVLEFKSIGAFTQLEYGTADGGGCGVTGVVNGSFEVEDTTLILTVNGETEDNATSVAELTTDRITLHTRWYFEETAEGWDDITFTKIAE